MPKQVPRDLAEAKRLLAESSLTAVNDDQVWRREGRGIRPLFTLIEEEGEKLAGGALADIVVGKAAALLAAYAGFTAVYARTLSKPAQTVLERHGILIDYDILTDRILNRNHTGFCPMETLTYNIEDPAAAYAAIAAKLANPEKAAKKD